MMFSLNLANVAITSALAVMPFSEQVYQQAQTRLAQPQQPVMNAELRETVMVSTSLLATFYQIASTDHAIFDRADKAELVALLTQAKQLAEVLNSRFSSENDMVLLSQFSQTFEKIDRLYQAIEYKKQSDEILLARANGAIGMTIPSGTSREEIKARLLARRKNAN